MDKQEFTAFALRFNLQKRIDETLTDDYARIAAIFDTEAQIIADIDSVYKADIDNAVKSLLQEVDIESLRNLNKRLVFVGDSNTSCRNGYRAILTELFQRIDGFECIDSSVSCEKSTEAVFEFRRRVTDQSPDIVSILIGSNGVRKANNPQADCIVSYSDFENHLRYMLNRMKEQKVRVLMHTLPPIDAELQHMENIGYDVSTESILEYNRIIKKMVEEFDCELNDAYRLFEGKKILEKDGIHLNAYGHYLMASSTLKKLIKLI